MFRDLAAAWLVSWLGGGLRLMQELWGSSRGLKPGFLVSIWGNVDDVGYTGMWPIQALGCILLICFCVVCKCANPVSGALQTYLGFVGVVQDLRSTARVGLFLGQIDISIATR